MWITLLAMAVAVSLEPFRIAMTILMINRRRPLMQLFVFLACGFAMGITVGTIVLFVLRPALGSAHFTLPRVQLAVGAVLLIYAAVVATDLIGRVGRMRGYGAAGRADRADRRFGPLAMTVRRGRQASRASASRCPPSTISPCWR
jgi:hypothetical protein